MQSGSSFPFPPEKVELAQVDTFAVVVQSMYMVEVYKGFHGFIGRLTYARLCHALVIICFC